MKGKERESKGQKVKVAREAIMRQGQALTKWKIN